MCLQSGSVDSELDCAFCGIAAGTVPSTIIAGSTRALAFMDINPVTHGHALVIPRTHTTDLLDVGVDDLAACVDLAQEIARRARDRLGADGVNLLNCSGAAAWQTVFHFHVHVIPRYANERAKDAIGLPWSAVPGDRAEIDRIGAILA